MSPWKDSSKGDISSSMPTATDGRDGVNLGGIRALVPVFKSGSERNCLVFTASEYFSNSGFLCIVGIHSTTWATDNTGWGGNSDDANAYLAKASYGSIWHGWTYLATNSSTTTYIRGQDPDHLMFVGTRQGTGMIARFILDANDWEFSIESTSTLTTATTNYTVYSAKTSSITNILYVEPPTNGMAQFKGLTTSANEKKYI